MAKFRSPTAGGPGPIWDEPHAATKSLHDATGDPACYSEDGGAPCRTRDLGTVGQVSEYV